VGDFWFRPMSASVIQLSNIELTGCVIMRAQASSRLFERLVFRFKVRDDGSVVGPAAHGRSVSQSLELQTNCCHSVVDLLAHWLI
jgi:hypothetical protein